MRHYYKLTLTVSVGIIALILQFGFHQTAGCPADYYVVGLRYGPINAG